MIKDVVPAKRKRRRLNKLSIKEVKENWELIKSQEKSGKDSKNPLSDQLRKIVRSQSAIASAVEISKQAAKAGFEWESIDGAWNKFHEELNELHEAINEKDMEKYKTMTIFVHPLRTVLKKYFELKASEK